MALDKERKKQIIAVMILALSFLLFLWIGYIIGFNKGVNAANIYWLDYIKDCYCIIK